MSQLIGAVDCGTTSARFFVFDEKANVVAQYQKEFKQTYPKQGWMEEDPDEIYDVCIECINGAVEKLEKDGKYKKSDIKGIGITNQRESTVVWDKKTGKKLHNVIVWPDTRNTGTVKKLAGKHEEGVNALKKKTGLPFSTYFAGVKLRWLLDNVSEVQEAHKNKNLYFGTIDTWLLWKLTGGLEGGLFLTDVTNASRTMFMNIETLEWATNCEMKFNLFLPPQALKSSAEKIPVLIYLSGLTCTGDNCSEKGFFQHRASQKGIAVVYPDTSPRGLGVAGEDDSYDFGSGAGFYVNATKEPYNKGYNMYSYITEDLPKALFSSFKQLDSDRVSITGHSMGGHGALTLFLKNPGKYKSVSAFAPIANPSNCDWGKKAFSGYFGEDQKEKWAEHDATELIKKWKGPLDMLIDVGTGDNFYKQGQLLPENLTKAAEESGNDKGVNLRMQPDYDHSYYFMSTFADDHVDHAAKYLLGQ